MPASRLTAWFLLWLSLAYAVIAQSDPAISLTVIPSDTTLHVGQTLAFTAVVTGASDASIHWSVQEPNGGTITDDGIYSARQEIGTYHVRVLALSNGLTAQTIAKVTVVNLYGTPPSVR
jgi:uncharacterized protein YjdB